MTKRRGYTILELLAVVAILGIVGSAAFSVMRADSTGNHGAKSAARTLAADLQQARQRAISTGDEHYLQFTYSGSYISGYTVYRAATGGDVAVESLRSIPEHVNVTINPEANQSPSFTFEGGATSSFEFALSSSNSNSSVTVAAATGRAIISGE